LDLSTLNRTAAEIAAAAFTELFPGIELLGGKRTSLGFSFDFLCETPLPAEAETLIEEKMRQIIREKRPIRVLEMVPFSARELLLKEGHAARADALEEEEGLVEIVQIGRFHNLSQGPHLSSISELFAFKLWPIQKGRGKAVRLTGCAFFEKDELKRFLKRLREYPERSHERTGIQKSFWRIGKDGQIVWLPAGLKIRQEIVETLRAHLFSGALEIGLSAGCDRPALHAALAREAGARGVAEIYVEPSPPWDPEAGLLSGVGGLQARLSLTPAIEKWKEGVISSLQFAEKTFTILAFRHRLRLLGQRRLAKRGKALLEELKTRGGEIEIEAEGEPRLELLVRDALGREWPAISIEMAPKGLFLKASVERFVALLLEMKLCTMDGSDE